MRRNCRRRHRDPAIQLGGQKSLEANAQVRNYGRVAGSAVRCVLHGQIVKRGVALKDVALSADRRRPQVERI